MKTFEPKIEKQPVTKEGADRKGRFPRDGFPEGAFPEINEDEELANVNNPSNKFVRPEDVADNSYLSFGEEEGGEALINEEIDEENHLLTDEEVEEIAAIREKNRKDLGRDEFYTIKNLSPENSGKIGAAHVSVKDGEILINREHGKAGAVDKESGVGLKSFIHSSMTEKEKQIIAEKYENLEESVPSGKMRLEAYKGGAIDSSIARRSSSRHGQSHRDKKEKPDRSLLREITEDTHEHPLDDVVF